MAELRLGRTMRHALGVVTLLAVGTIAAACGGDAPPAESVPHLADRLERVDEAIADDRPGQARRAVEALVDEATAARMRDDLTAEQADAILRAAARLLDRLPTTPDPSPEPTEPVEPTSPPGDPEGREPEGGDEEHGDEKDEKHEKEEDKGKKDHGDSRPSKGIGHGD